MKAEIIKIFREAAAGYPQKIEDRRQIGYFCAYTPEELLSLGGLVPYRMRAPGCGGTDFADTYLGRVTCSYTRCLLEMAEEGKYEALDGMVFVTGCDHMRRLHDNLIYLKKLPFVVNLDLPHKTSPEAVRWYTGELKRLAAALEKSFGVDASGPAVSAAIRRRNQLRGLLAAVDDLRERAHPPLSGSEMLAVTAGVTALTPDAGCDRLEALLGAASKDAGRSGHRARLLLVSSQLDDPAYVEVLEATGGLIVGEIGCTGASAFRETVDEQAPPFEALSRRYLNRVPCPRMMEEHGALFENVRKLVGSRRADGVVIVCMKFCDTWGYAGTLLSRKLRAAGVPVLRLEREYILAGEGQVATRVQAFLESLGR
jgi:benzoyl-CoA reductase/2-hydroxyglutaryl-CoA dehydratase subunit BcrC/BadD/HgdB